jgi:hypothetical protein
MNPFGKRKNLRHSFDSWQGNRGRVPPLHEGVKNFAEPNHSAHPLSVQSGLFDLLSSYSKAQSEPNVALSAPIRSGQQVIPVGALHRNHTLGIAHLA